MKEMTSVEWMLLILMSFTWSSVLTAEPYLLVACRTSIEKLSLESGEQSTFMTGLKHVSALAHDYDEQLLFYSDTVARTISKVDLDNPRNVMVIVDVYLFNVNGLTLDPQAKRIYWADEEDGVLESCDYEGGNRQLILKGLRRPHGLVMGFSNLFWTDWDAGEIETMDVNGGERQVVVSGGGPMAIAFDSRRQTLYWSSAHSDEVRMRSLADADAPILVSDVYHVNGLALYGDHLYVSELYDNKVHRVDRVTGQNRTLVMNVSLPGDMTVVMPFSFKGLKQPLLRLGFDAGSPVFVCTLPQPDEKAGDGYRVRWISGPNIIKTDTVTSEKAMLKVEDIKVGTIVDASLICTASRMKSINGRERYGPESNSSIFKAEVKKISSDNMVLEEGGDDGEIHVQFTGPPVFFGARKMYLDVELENTNDEIWRENDDERTVIDQVVVKGKKGPDGQFTSKILVDDTNWFLDHTFVLMATPDGRQDGDKRRTLSVTLTPLEDGKRRKRNAGIPKKISQTMVTTEDKDEVGVLCKITNDPNFVSFASTSYYNHYQGEFILYKHARLDIQINTVLTPCDAILSATCSCGAAIKNINDIIVFDMCPRINQIPALSRPIRVYHLLQKNTASNTRITAVNDEKFQVTLKHFGVVTVTMSGGFLQIEYKPSIQDHPRRGRTLSKGLCGCNNKRKDKDLALRNGNIITIPASRDAGEFNINWRARGDDSLFRERDPPPNIDEKENVFCFIRVGNEMECSTDLDSLTKPSVGGKEFNSTKYYYGRRRRRRRKKRALVDSLEFDPFAPLAIDESAEPGIAKWPTRSNVTEEKARDFCTKRIIGDRASGLCSQLMADEYKADIESCVNDIGLTDDLSWVNSTIAGIRQTCVTYKDSLDNTAAEGAPPPPLPNGVNETELVESLCPDDCNKRGVCRKAVCKCDPGYVGADCSMKLSDPPEVDRVMSSNLCDINEMSCEGALILGDKFHDRPTLTCHLQKYELGKPLPALSSNFINVSGSYILRDQVFCPVPFGEPHLIQISNDGKHPHHNRLFYFSHNGDCLDCEMGDHITDTTCVRVPKTCMIGQLCVEHGTMHPASRCHKCDADNNDSGWSQIFDSECAGSVDDVRVSAPEDRTVMYVVLALVLLLIVILLLLAAVWFKKRHVGDVTIRHYVEMRMKREQSSLDAPETQKLKYTRKADEFPPLAEMSAI